MEPPSPHRIEVLDRSGRRLDVSGLRRAIAATLDRFLTEPALVSVLVALDEEVARLNGEFRKVPVTTDVLSFPAPHSTTRAGGHRILGDIAISADEAARQAAARGIAIGDELAYLAIHGSLHLLGYDDTSDHGRAEMQRIAAEVGAAVGLPLQLAWASISPRKGAVR